MKTKLVDTQYFCGVVYYVRLLVVVCSCWYCPCPESSYPSEAFCCQADPLWRRDTRTETAQGEFVVVNFPLSGMYFIFIGFETLLLIFVIL